MLLLGGLAFDINLVSLLFLIKIFSPHLLLSLSLFHPIIFSLPILEFSSDIWWQRTVKPKVKPQPRLDQIPLRPPQREGPPPRPPPLPLLRLCLLRLPLIPPLRPVWFVTEMTSIFLIYSLINKIIYPP